MTQAGLTWLGGGTAAESGGGMAAGSLLPAGEILIGAGFALDGLIFVADQIHKLVTENYGLNEIAEQHLEEWRSIHSRP